MPAPHKGRVRVRHAAGRSLFKATTHPRVATATHFSALRFAFCVWQAAISIRDARNSRMGWDRSEWEWEEKWAFHSAMFRSAMLTVRINRYLHVKLHVYKKNSSNYFLILSDVLFFNIINYLIINSSCFFWVYLYFTVAFKRGSKATANDKRSVLFRFVPSPVPAQMASSFSPYLLR